MNAIDAFSALERGLPELFWLDSVRGDAELGRRSLLALALGERIVIDAHHAAVYASDGDVGAQRAAADRALAGLSEAWTRSQTENATSPLGWVGWVSYEAAPLFDSAFQTSAPDIHSPPALFVAEVAVALAFDANGVRLIAKGSNLQAAEGILASWRDFIEKYKDAGAKPGKHVEVVAESAMTEERYRLLFAAVLDAIEEGEVYQACLTYDIAVQTSAPLADLYGSMRARFGADYSCFIRVGDTWLASFSPERFLRVEGRRVVARPMKGTRRVTGDAARDEAAAAELVASEKERAENIMIVDLLRNDLGRVCETGSIGVPRLFEVERYNTVMQLTSTIEGQLLPQTTPFDLLRATFPPGSMTGAPKIAAVKLLAGLEARPRGLYAGSVFWLGFDGRWDFSVVIRSLQSWGDDLRWDTGGGLVADSEAGAEWAETRLKAAAVLHANDA